MSTLCCLYDNKYPCNNTTQCTDCSHLKALKGYAEDHKNEGKKDDAGKARFDLVKWGLIHEGAKVLAHGANKYGANNWQKVENAKDRYWAAAMRHLIEYREWGKLDEESGLSHLAHAFCNLMFMYEKDRETDPLLQAVLEAIDDSKKK